MLSLVQVGASGKNKCFALEILLGDYTTHSGSVVNRIYEQKNLSELKEFSIEILTSSKWLTPYLGFDRSGRKPNDLQATCDI